MKKALSACLFSTALLFPFAASAQAPLVRFDSGIGVVPVRAGPAANIVRGVNPGGQPWVISRLTVDIKTDGRISVDGRGLLLGGGDAIGFHVGFGFGAGGEGTVFLAPFLLLPVETVGPLDDAPPQRLGRRLLG